MILNETLRLYPPAVATVRRAKADVELGGYLRIPRDTELLIPIMAVHHDARLWGPTRRSSTRRGSPEAWPGRRGTRRRSYRSALGHGCASGRTSPSWRRS